MGIDCSMLAAGLGLVVVTSLSLEDVTSSPGRCTCWFAKIAVTIHHIVNQRISSMRQDKLWDPASQISCETISQRDGSMMTDSDPFARSEFVYIVRKRRAP